MSTAADYVTFLERSGVKLWVDDGQLRYHAKKGVLGSEELARLRSMRSEIVAELMQAASRTVDDSSRAHAASAVEGPVSFQQRWFLKLLEEHPTWKATLSYVFHLKGALDPTALERGFEGILRRHASFRTRMRRIGGEWWQEVDPGECFRLPIVHVSGETDVDRQRSALVVIQERAARELDPIADCLMNAQLVRASAQEHFLVVLIHRLATDCLGIGQAFRDLWVSYVQTVQKGLEGPARYLDYALWQHNTDKAWRQKHAAYWNDHLAGAECIRWPMREGAPPGDRNAPGVLTSLEISFGETLSAGLRELGRQTQTLPGLVVLSVYAIGISIRCGQKDLVIPFLIAGRGAAHEGVVGCFSHVVYLRIRLNGSESFAEVLKLVSNEFYRAAAFRQDAGRMATERPELLQGTLCQWLSWHPADIAGLQADDQVNPLGLVVERMRCQSLEELTNVPPDRVDLEISFFDAAGSISALAIYRKDRFVEGAMVQLVEGLRAIADHAVREPSEPFWSY